MLRRLFNLAAAVSLLLCLALLFVRWRGRTIIDEFDFGYSRLYSARGNVAYVWTDRMWSMYGFVHYTWSVEDPEPGILLDVLDVLVDSPGSLGFRMDARAIRIFTLPPRIVPDAIDRVVVFPLWSVMTLFGLLPALWLRERIPVLWKAKRQRQGLCKTCGYDLRASNHRCPECGMPIAEPTTIIQRRPAPFRPRPVLRERVGVRAGKVLSRPSPQPSPGVLGEGEKNACLSKAPIASETFPSGARNESGAGRSRQ